MRPSARIALLSAALLLPTCGKVKSPTAPPQAAETSVAVSNFQFTPSQLTIAVGDTVTFTNAGGFHNVRADDGSFRCAEGCDGAGGNGAPSGSAWSFAHTFTTPGVVRYYCEVHGGPGGAGMSGTIVVGGS